MAGEKGSLGGNVFGKGAVPLDERNFGEGNLADGKFEGKVLRGEKENSRTRKKRFLMKRGAFLREEFLPDGWRKGEPWGKRLEKRAVPLNEKILVRETLLTKTRARGSKTPADAGARSLRFSHSFGTGGSLLPRRSENITGKEKTSPGEIYYQKKSYDKERNHYGSH